MQKRSPTLEDARAIISELAAREEVIAIILFGSLARNEARPVSDIDLCIVTKKIPEPVKMDLLSYGSETIDISLLSELPLPIRYRAIREGTVLSCRDTPALHAVLADTVRSYLDIEPFIHRISHRIIGTREVVAP